MCGLFGAIDTMGKGINQGAIRSLAIVNRERGTDSLGFFDNSGKSVKCADDPLKALRSTRIANFLDHDGRWFLAGHTRLATRGSVSKRNAHPFRFGSIIGSHNGMVHAPAEYAVDSQVLFDQLNKCDNDYQKALEDISGYWGLTWFDGDDFYVQAHDNEIWFASDDFGVYYYSSDDEHLESATGLTDLYCVHGGETWVFRKGQQHPEELTKFTSQAYAHWYNKSATSGYSSGKGGYSSYSTATSKSGKGAVYGRWDGDEYVGYYDDGSTSVESGKWDHLPGPNHGGMDAYDGQAYVKTDDGEWVEYDEFEEDAELDRLAREFGYYDVDDLARTESMTRDEAISFMCDLSNTGGSVKSIHSMSDDEFAEGEDAEDVPFCTAGVDDEDESSKAAWQLT